MNSFDHISIIYNPNSTGDAEKNSKVLQTSLLEHLIGIPIELVPTKHAGHAIELAYDAACAHKNPLIISASGDGGYNEVVNGAMKAQSEGATPICAVLPSGNANDHARTMQEAPLDERIISGKMRQLDVLNVTMKKAGSSDESRYVHSYVGLGASPAIAAELDKKRNNSFGEALTVWRTFWKLNPVIIKTARGISKLDSLVFSVIPEMAKVFTLSADAAPDDGKFEITLLPHKHKSRLLYQLARGIFSSMESHSREKDYNFIVLQRAPIQFDGEVSMLQAGTSISVSICANELRTIV